MSLITESYTQAELALAAYSILYFGMTKDNFVASVGRISLRNPPDEKMSQILKSFKIPPTDNASLIRPTKSYA